MSTLTITALTMKKWMETRSVLVIGITLGVAFLISTGPHFQITLFALFDVNRLSLYDTVVPDGIAMDSGPKLWLLKAFDMPWIIVALVAALISTHMRSWTSMVIAVGVTASIGMTFADLSYGLIYGLPRTDVFVGAVVANVLGGILISVELFLVLWISILLSDAIGLRKSFSNILAGVTAAISGVIISLMLYLATAVYLHPLEVKARILAKLPIEGVVGKSYADKKAVDEIDSFRYVGKGTRLKYVKLNNARKLDWKWTRVDKSTEFAAAIYLLKGCTSLEQAKGVARQRAFKEVSDLEGLRISVDDWVMEFSIEGRQTGTDVVRGTVSQFWIKPSDTGSGVDLEEFLTDGNSVRASTRGNFVLFATALTIGGDENSDVVHVVPRTIAIEANDQKSFVTFAPGDWSNEQETLSCEILDPKSDAIKDNTYGNVALAGIFVDVTRTQVPSSYLARFDGMYKFDPALGLFRREGVPHSKLSAIAAREIGMIVIESPIDELFVDGEAYEVPTGAGFRGHGRIRASYDEASGMTFVGTFHAAWLDKRRLNKTQWENWTTETHILILTTMASVVAAIVTVIYRTRNRWSVYMRKRVAAMSDSECSSEKRSPGR